VVTNLFEDHLNRYSGMADYALAKAGIVAFQRAGDVAVLNLDNAWSRAMGEEPDARTDAMPASDVRWFSAKRLAGKREGACLDAGYLTLVEAGRRTRLLPAKALRVPGAHNVDNALAAAAAARAWGVPARTIAAGLKAFAGAPSRQELVATIAGARWINDTTATSPDGVIMALRTFGDAKKKRVVLIGGGVDKSLQFDAWAKEVKKYVRHLVLFDAPSTTATPRMRAALERAKAAPVVRSAAGMGEAVRLAAAAAKRGDVVILSPGCASFGLFVHEFDRGERFVHEVKRLARRAKK
jgi:UDP-N-acetylmuramoylalanine--D-glutamate ligase